MNKKSLFFLNIFLKYADKKKSNKEFNWPLEKSGIIYLEHFYISHRLFSFLFFFIHSLSLSLSFLYLFLLSIFLRFTFLVVAVVVVVVFFFSSLLNCVHKYFRLSSFVCVALFFFFLCMCVSRGIVWKSSPRKEICKECRGKNQGECVTAAFRSH